MKTILLALLASALAVGGAMGRDAVERIRVDYPEDGSIFPPQFPAPSFLWHDDSGATLWRIAIRFSSGPALYAQSRGAHPRVGAVDPEAVADTNEPPRLSAEQASARTWTPDAATWAAVARRSTGAAAVVRITGYRAGVAVSRGETSLRTSKDPVGAPIFYRDVPLMPSELEKGVIKPLAAAAIPLVAWRLRDTSETRSRVVMENLPVCANCHSFSRDGKTLGMDLDGLGGNRGMYLLAPVTKKTRVEQKDVLQWSTSEGKLAGKVRVGFLSQVSPTGEYVITTVNPERGENPSSNYYVANFRDYRFLQVFFPTRGILSWYSRATGVLQPLAGADDPRFVQMGAVWSPDGSELVFARAAAQEANPAGAKMARFANDPDELQIRYDLYRIPFRGGRGGEAEPIRGASNNGMSNTFPKLSPDGRWLVFVRCRNGQLMRPDSELWIVAAGGGTARRMRANTRLMNSWHSFSPNGRWLVFSSKARSPYTQLYLTHIDEDGNDSPAILIENTTAANRAANLPEFVNVEKEGLEEIGGPALEYFRLVNSAVYLEKRRRYEESAAKWEQVLAMRADDEMAHRGLGTVLMLLGRRKEAAEHRRKLAELRWRRAVAADAADGAARNELGAVLLESGAAEAAEAELREARRLRPALVAARVNLGRALAAQGKLDEALAELRGAIEADGKQAAAHVALGAVLERRGDRDGAAREWERAAALDARNAEAQRRLAGWRESRGETGAALEHWKQAVALRGDDAESLERGAWAMATSRDRAVRDGALALEWASRAMRLSGGGDARVLDTLAAAYAERGRFGDALATSRRALARAVELQDDALAAAIRARMAEYSANRAHRE